jgi:aryl-alcohol dehydrogenase-like predicted oxidoreductase
MGVAAGASMIGETAWLIPRSQTMIRKPIPRSGEMLPVIGLGSWVTFNLSRDSLDWQPAREVIRAFHRLGGRVIDTAASYQRSESFIGETASEFGLAEDLFLATKVNVGEDVLDAGGRDAALVQMETSSRLLHKPKIDLMQVWNLGDSTTSLSDRFLAAHMEAVSAFKAAGRARYVGITTSFSQQYDAVEKAITALDLDFVQLDYSIGARVPEQRLLPLASERGVAVIANRPFTTGNLFTRVAGKTLPPWTSEFDCRSWAQFFLKYIVSHPAVTCTVPATNDPAHLRDNMGACAGRLPDAATRARMVQHFLTL